MAIQRWEPFRDMVTLRDAVDRLFDDSFVPSLHMRGMEDGGFLPLDVYQTDSDVVIKASLPGYEPEEVEISLTGDVLTIRGEHKDEKETKEENYWLKERSYGSFSRSITIPVDVQSDKAEATFENGVLKLTLPKAEEIKPKQIKVKAKSALKPETKSEGGKK